MTHPSLPELIHVFARIGILSFGGPAAQISLMHKELVDDRDWLSNDTFLRALSLCMLLPGPEAMQLATYAGWRLRGTIGGLIAGGLFVLPGAVVIMALALAYAHYGQIPWVQAAFLGVKAAVIIIVMQALSKVSQRALHTPLDWALAAGAFVALFLVGAPYPLIILTAGVLGALFRAQPPVTPPPQSAPRAHPGRIIAIWGTLWLAPLALLAVLDQAFLLDIGLFFSKLAVVTFGGAYAVLAYMTQSIVSDFGWISTAQMIDALGLAETTPGPLILVTQFVAMLAGFLEQGAGLAVAAGVVALWVTFVPCFLWIFLAGPYLDDIASHPRIAGALAAITAAVVGVIVNLALWFARHVWFYENGSPQAMWWPDIAHFNLTAIALTAVAAVLLLWFKRGIVQVLAIMALAGILLGIMGPA
ncbi:MAG: chromate efflux transporter [Roseobacter sp.]